MSYPILVRRFEGAQSLTIVCEDCHAERVIGEDEISNEMLYSCPANCGSLAVYKYDEGDPCPNCGKLGYWEPVLSGCCSRVCQLQAEYAAELAARKATA